MTGINYYEGTQFFPYELKKDAIRQKLDGFWIKILELSLRVKAGAS